MPEQEPVVSELGDSSEHDRDEPRSRSTDRQGRLAEERDDGATDDAAHQPGDRRDSRSERDAETERQRDEEHDEARRKVEAGLPFAHRRVAQALDLLRGCRDPRIGVDGRGVRIRELHLVDEARLRKFGVVRHGWT